MPHSYKIQSRNLRGRGKIDTSNTHIYITVHYPPWLGADTSEISGGITYHFENNFIMKKFFKELLNNNQLSNDFSSIDVENKLTTNIACAV